MLPALQQPIQSTREYAISLLRDEFRSAVDNLPPELAGLTQDQLEEKRKPTDIDYFLRKKLWTMVEMAQKGAVTEIVAMDIYKGICSKQAFYQAITSPLRVAWFLTVPHADQEIMEAGLTIGLRNLIKFVSKEPDADTASAFIKALEILLNRVHGPIVQRIDARHAHAHMKVAQPAPVVEDPEKRLEDLRAKLKGQEQIDVSPRKAE